MILMKNSLKNLLGHVHIGIVEKVQETSLDIGIQNMCMCAISVLLDRWMQDTPTSHCVLPYSSPPEDRNQGNS